jgi:hypothetical protein
MPSSVCIADIFPPDLWGRQGASYRLVILSEVEGSHRSIGLRLWVLRGGKGNRHYGHRSRGTYALTLLTPPKQRTVLFGKCGVRPSAPLHYAQDDNRWSADSVCGVLHRTEGEALLRCTTLRMTGRGF